MTEVEEIISFCEFNIITNYKINDDSSIDVNGNVSFWIGHKLKIPIKFNKVTGHFVINHGLNSELESLENSPREVGGTFNASNVKLKSLKGSPDFIGGDFFCYNNNITTLEYFPSVVVGNIEIFSNPIESLDGYNGNYNKILIDNKVKLIRKHKLKILKNI